VQDPFLSLIAPRTGTYIVQLREATYGGSDKSHYRLHVGTFPPRISTAGVQCYDIRVPETQDRRVLHPAGRRLDPSGNTYNQTRSRGQRAHRVDRQNPIWIAADIRLVRPRGAPRSAKPVH